MSKYELLYIVDRDLTDENRETLIEKIKGLMVEKGAEITSVDKWGIKKLAYPINFKHEGFYVLVTFATQNNKLVGEMGNLINITDGVVRHLFVKKEN